MTMTPNSMSDSFDGAPGSPPNPIRSIAPAFLIVLLFAVLVWLPIALPASRTGDSTAEEPFPVAQMGDQIHWHERVVRDFAAEFPAFDFADYASAIAPGYYVVMATVAQLNDSRLALQLVSSGFGLLLLLAVWRLVQVFSPLSSTDALVFPLVLSPYVIATSIWLNTDNLALFLIVCAISVLIVGTPTPRRILIGIALVTLTVFVRQVHIWMAAPALLGIVLVAPATPDPLRRKLFGHAVSRASWPITLMLCIAALAPFAVLLWLVLVWGGLTPPNPHVTELHDRGLNLAAYPYTLALIGAFGVFFAPFVFENFRSAVRVDHAIIIAVALAVIVCLITPTTFDKDAGRISGWLWGAVRLTRAATIAERSLLLIPLAAFGAVFLVHAWRRARDDGRQAAATVLLLTMCGWLLAQSLNGQVYQRYYEPLILIFLTILTALAQARERPYFRRSAILALLILSAFQMGLSIARIYIPLFGTPGGPGG